MTLNFSNLYFNIDTSSNITSLLDYDDAFQLPNLSNIYTDESLLMMYKKEIEYLKMDNSNDSESNSEETLTKQNLEFLNNIISIKMKILYNKNKYKSLCEKSNEVSKEIEKINDMIESYEKFSNLYSCILNKRSDYNVIDNIIEKLNSKNLEKQALDYEINNLITKNETLRNIIIKTDNLFNNENKENKNKINILCKICDESDIEYCLNPCGHTFCKHCVSRLKNTCFTCRSKINSKIKVYI
jgi:hypothetical protein